jgi:hypothetical protein
MCMKLILKVRTFIKGLKRKGHQRVTNSNETKLIISFEKAEKKILIVIMRPHIYARTVTTIRGVYHTLE